MHPNYDYLDLGQFRSLYCLDQKPQAMKFYVEGIKCSKCIAKIEGLKNHNPDLKNLEVDLANQTAFIELNQAENSFAKVAEDISELGFRPIPIQPNEDSHEQWKTESKMDLIRLGVAGFCAGNIMMLAFATYFGLVGPMKTLFEWVQLILYLPVVSFVAWPFYKGFLSGLKQKSLSIDGPMAIASFLGFTVSTWNLMRGTGSVYFDSLSGFLFLILATRYIQKKTRFEYLKFLKPSSLADTMKARLNHGAQWTWVRSDQLKAGDVISVETGEWIPADGTLINSQAVLDLSVLDGESMPRQVNAGFPVKAGSRLMSAAAQVQVSKSGNQTLLGHLLSSINFSSLNGTQSSKASDQASQVLLFIVLSLGAVTLASGFWLDFETQFEKAFALIILACPCAMAFGTPLAFAFSMKRAQDKGLIIKSAKTFEDLETINTVFLDKTGTLTEKFWNLKNSSLDQVPDLYKQYILLLESKSQHPVAFALREIWSDIQIPQDLILSSPEEIPSVGVKGTVNSIELEFRHFFEGGEKWFGLYQSGQLIWRFQLQPVLQKGTHTALEYFKKRNFNIFLLSGDSLTETQKISEELGLCPVQVHADLTPQMKNKIVSQHPHSLMIGDGVNDSLALQSAKVGVAVKGGVELALKSADVLFLNGGISLLPELFITAQKARRQIKYNLISAVFYNVIGGTAALLGWVDPFIAALLMPISSLFILTNTWWGTRR